MKKILIILLLTTSIAAAYEMPKYVANPETYECKYYFAGDEKHFNPRPENFTIDIGDVTGYKDVDDACMQWKCSATRGKWISGNCTCPGNSAWKNNTGCVATGSGPVMSEEEICKGTKGVWAAGICTCTTGAWDSQKGCVINGNPVPPFNSKGTGLALWALAILIAAGLVFRKKIILILKNIPQMKTKGEKNENKSA